jgi:predicted nuclease of restriction endonuclease-like (RecB) superfamily
MQPPKTRLLVALLGALSLTSWTWLVAREQQRQDPLAEAFKGVTANGTIVPGLFAIRATGVPTGPVREAAVKFLAALTDEQRTSTTFPIDDDEWRKWNNVHRYARQGISFKEMSDSQRALGFALMQAGLSAKGFQKSRDVMRLNGYVAELVKNPEEYGEYLYHLTVMGTPSEKQPWGWQLDGHHLIINYFVLGDQVVMTPTFMGSEPVSATTGQYAGTKVLQDEQDMGLAFMQSLSLEQQKQATIQTSKTGNNALSQAFRDNLTLDYAGLRAKDLAAPQRERLLAVIQEYVGNLDSGHARVRMDEVRKHLDDTWFGWIGASGKDDVFYYRIHSPVILIEFDHQLPVALGGPRVPGKVHVHTVVRTPNGNDYGKDLLRQHYEKHANDPAHGHARD